MRTVTQFVGKHRVKSAVAGVLFALVMAMVAMESRSFLAQIDVGESSSSISAMVTCYKCEGTACLSTGEMPADACIGYAEPTCGNACTSSSVATLCYSCVNVGGVGATCSSTALTGGATCAGFTTLATCMASCAVSSSSVVPPPVVCGDGKWEDGEACDGGERCKDDCTCPFGTEPNGKGGCKCSLNVGNGGACCESLDDNGNGKIDDPDEARLTTGPGGSCGGAICIWCEGDKGSTCNLAVIQHCGDCSDPNADGDPENDDPDWERDVGCVCDRPLNENCTAQDCTEPYVGACDKQCTSATQIDCYVKRDGGRVVRGTYTGKLYCDLGLAGEDWDPVCSALGGGAGGAAGGANGGGDIGGVGGVGGVGGIGGIDGNAGGEEGGDNGGGGSSISSNKSSVSSSTSSQGSSASSNGNSSTVSTGNSSNNSSVSVVNSSLNSSVNSSQSSVVSSGGSSVSISSASSVISVSQSSSKSSVLSSVTSLSSQSSAVSSVASSTISSFSFSFSFSQSSTVSSATTSIASSASSNLSVSFSRGSSTSSATSSSALSSSTSSIVVFNAFCGDGIVQAELGEDCDLGTKNGVPGTASGCSCDPNLPGCVSVIPGIYWQGCRWPRCGDGIVNNEIGYNGKIVNFDLIAEECDDGNKKNGDGCNSQCQVEKPTIILSSESSTSSKASAKSSVGRTSSARLVAAAGICGDGQLDVGEECDDSNRRDNDGCNSACLLEIGICGDGIVQTLLGEQCESSSHDTSLPYSCVRCQFVSESCGDGVVDPGEECDRGTLNSTSPNAACRPNCHFASCGDGILDSTELCDDGNRLSGDGCSRYCTIDEKSSVSSRPTAVATDSQEIPFNYQQPNSWPYGFQFPYQATTTQIPYQLPLAQLQPLVQGQAPVGDTGPAAVAVIGAGAAAGFSWMRRKKK